MDPIVSRISVWVFFKLFDGYEVWISFFVSSVLVPLIFVNSLFIIIDAIIGFIVY